MKKSIFKLALLLFIIPQIGFANVGGDLKQEKSKTIKKEFKVDSDATVDIENKYGDVTVTTWDRNQVEITVIITVKGNSLSTIEKRLDGIDVQFSGSASYVKAKTIIEKSGWSLWGSSSNVSYQINYTVKMPASNNVKLNNDYGSIVLDELNGEANINCDYGKLIIGSLNNLRNEINIDYCSGSTINYMKNGSINADYSKLTVDKAYDLSVNADYSTLNFGKVNGIDFNGDYGSINVDEANNMVANTDYVSVRIGTIRNNLKLDSDYGSIKIAELANGFNSADINGQYTGISIGIKSNNKFQFTVDLSYAGFSYDDDQVDMYKSIEKSSKKYYEGVYGKGSSKSKLSIKSQYGSVKLKD